MDADMECILHMLVDIMALQHLERQAAKAASSQCTARQTDCASAQGTRCSEGGESPPAPANRASDPESTGCSDAEHDSSVQQTDSVSHVRDTGSIEGAGKALAQQDNQHAASIIAADAVRPDGKSTQQQGVDAVDDRCCQTSIPPAICHADFEQLQHHPGRMSSRDLQVKLCNVLQLRRSMSHRSDVQDFRLRSSCDCLGAARCHKG